MWFWQVQLRQWSCFARAVRWQDRFWGCSTRCSRRSMRFAPRVSAAAEMVLLSKYPAFVLVIAGGVRDDADVVVPRWCAYAGACAYEAWHDRGSALGMIVRLKPDTTNTGRSIRRFGRLIASGFSRTNASKDKTNEMRRPMWQ